jgi:hypothetical protein
MRNSGQVHIEQVPVEQVPVTCSNPTNDKTPDSALYQVQNPGASLTGVCFSYLVASFVGSGNFVGCAVVI